MNIKWNIIFIKKLIVIQNKMIRKKDYFGYYYNFINWRSDNIGVFYVDLWSNMQILFYIKC